MDMVPALEKPSAGEPLMVGGSNGSLSFQRSIVRLYFGEKHRKILRSLTNLPCSIQRSYKFRDVNMHAV